MKTDKFTLFIYCNFLVLLCTIVCSQNKQNVNIADETITDYSFLSRYHCTKSKNSLKRRYRIRHWIPMFIGTPCMYDQTENVFFKWAGLVKFYCDHEMQLNDLFSKAFFLCSVTFFLSFSNFVYNHLLFCRISIKLKTYNKALCSYVYNLYCGPKGWTKLADFFNRKPMGNQGVTYAKTSYFVFNIRSFFFQS